MFVVRLASPAELGFAGSRSGALNRGKASPSFYKLCGTIQRLVQIAAATT